MPNFKFLWPALLVFCPKMPKLFTFFHWPNIFCKILVVFHHLKKDSPFFVPKWAWNKSLLFGTFDLLNFHCLTHSALDKLTKSPTPHLKWIKEERRLPNTFIKISAIYIKNKIYSTKLRPGVRTWEYADNDLLPFWNQY